MLSHNNPYMETHGGTSQTSAPQPFATSSANSTLPPSTPSYAMPPSYAAPSGSVQVGVGKGFVERQIRSSNTTLVLLNTFMLVLCIALLIVALNDASSQKDVEWLPYAAGAFSLLALWNLGQFVRRVFNPMAHPTMQTLAKHGPVHEVIARINNEMAAPPQRIGNAQLTPSWILRPGAFRLGCLPVEQVAWIYKKVTQHYHNGIPTGKTYSVMVYAQDGQHLELSSKKKLVDGVVESIGQRVPWAIIGHTPQIENFWNANRDQVVAQIHKRRQEMLSGAPSTASDAQI